MDCIVTLIKNLIFFNELCSVRFCFVNYSFCTCALHLSKIKRINTTAAFYVHVRRWQYHIGSQGVVCNEEHGTGLAGRRLRRDELTRVYAHRVCMVCSRYGSAAHRLFYYKFRRRRRHKPGTKFMQIFARAQIAYPRSIAKYGIRERCAYVRTFAVSIVEILSESERYRRPGL